MAVVIKDMNMPDTCFQCPFFCDDGDYPTCYVNGRSAGYTFEYKKTRMDNCPIEPTIYFDDKEKEKKECKSCVEHKYPTCSMCTIDMKAYNADSIQNF